MVFFSRLFAVKNLVLKARSETVGYAGKMIWSVEIQII